MVCNLHAISYHLSVMWLVFIFVVMEIMHELKVWEIFPIVVLEINFTLDIELTP